MVVAVGEREQLGIAMDDPLLVCLQNNGTQSDQFHPDRVVT